MTALAVLPQPSAEPARETRRLLSGPALVEGAEPLGSHRDRLGHRPHGGEWLFDVVAESGLRGRGGGWFPTARKWDAVTRSGREPVLVVNASEGEPLSLKDRTLVLARPHLVLDGAMLIAESIGAASVIVYLSRPARKAEKVLRQALRERRRERVRDLPVTFVATAHRYVAGESSAVIRRIAGGPAKPEFSASHPRRRGILGMPALVQNVETVAHVGLLARHGAGWFRTCGTSQAPGTALLTLAGNVGRPGVYEVAVGTPAEDVLALAGGPATPPRGALIGGYFGTWTGPGTLDDVMLAPETTTVGCGLVAVLGEDDCGLRETARIAGYLARESAGQCGPCVHGLPAIAGSLEALAIGTGNRCDVELLHRWCAQVRGRGACHHPDGAVSNTLSALDTFAPDVERHLNGDVCAPAHASRFPQPPASGRRWR